MRRTLTLALLSVFASLAVHIGDARADCAGDCDGNGVVAINELILGVSIALGATDVSACAAIDTDQHGDVTINELVAAVNRALAGCPATPTALESTATATSTSTSAATATSTTALTATATAIASATATHSAAPSPTATLTPAPTLNATATASATALATASETPPPTNTASTTIAATATITTTGASTATATDTPIGPTVTPTAAATSTETAPATPTVTATAIGPIETSTPTSSPTPTASATPGITAVCGNGFIEAGETCTSCATDCTVGSCTATTPLQTFKVVFQAPLGSLPTVTSVLVGYRSDRVSLPNSGTGARVKLRPAGTSQLVNDLNYAVRVLINAMPGNNIPSGRLFTVDFDSCSGKPAVTPADFGCQVESCGSSAGPIEDCTCSVTVP